ncbi:MAG: dienelactone hydrolase family protein [Methanomicrobiaceae archaeon]|nr:dienelactone hydrolase family protein [Methanomicrobiaceae archaeon]
MMRKLILVSAVVVLAMLPGCIDAGGETDDGQFNGAMVEVESRGLTYPAYIAHPEGEAKYPTIVLIHSFMGLEPGYREMADRIAAEGFVVIAPEWQTYKQSPTDRTMEALIEDTLTYLDTRIDVDPSRFGLTGFCAGGRYTMLFLPQIEAFGSGVAWYGFPYSGGFTNETAPASLIDGLDAPLLIIHGTRDEASPIEDIYRYATDLDASGRYFELKVYQGEPHGFMIVEGQLSASSVANDAYDEMVTFFKRTLQ